MGPCLSAKTALLGERERGLGATVWGLRTQLFSISSDYDEIKF
jgi:hypothetical protein